VRRAHRLYPKLDRDYKRRQVTRNRRDGRMAAPINISKADEKRIDLALRRYDCVFKYLAYENNVYWVRGQFFMLGNTALFGFVINNLPTKGPLAPSWNQICATAISGLVLTCLWRLALTSGEHWIRHWTEILRDDLEPDAFGEGINVLRKWKFREPPAAPPRSPSAKRLAHLLVILFTGAWGLTIIYVVFLGWAKFIGWAPAFSN
jgi:hypothetical protein